MNEQTVQRVERISMVMVIMATLASLIAWQRPVFLGVGLGGVLAFANFHALRRILQGLFQSQGKRSGKQAALAVLLTAKFGLLAASIFIVVRYLPVEPLAFVAGMSTVVLAIFVEGIRVVLNESEAAAE